SSLEKGADLIVTSGGMSVDPDDVTRLGIARAGATDCYYGTPVLPGAMFLSGRIGDIPVLGLPACGMFHKITVFDLILPRILAGERIGREEFAVMGHGGLCRNCKRCQYPVCNFGK
ncbi:MAG: molybdopterin-binding protein, partial [Thermodesulfobacteriota bacterium]